MTPQQRRRERYYTKRGCHKITVEGLPTPTTYKKSGRLKPFYARVGREVVRFVALGGATNEFWVSRGGNP